MLDQALGRPSPTVRRTQIFLVLFFWVWRLYKGDGSAMGAARSGRRRPVIRARLGSHAVRTVTYNRSWWRRVWVFLVARRSGMQWMTNINERLKYFTPYQLILGTLTIIYAFRHLDDLLGLSAPDPTANLYSRSYYRATYINTALDAGFASAMSIRPKWLKDISSIAFSVYYLIYANAGDEVLRRFRALCSVEMLRVTWEKTSNPYIKFFTTGDRPGLPVVRYIMISRPKHSSRASLPAVKGKLFFDGPAKLLAKATELIIDFPGGGFIAMGPEHHEERLRQWARRTGKPVFSIDYGKAPEYPYPWAIEEGFDAYRTIMECKGEVLGIKSGKLSVVLTGDSAGGNICTTIMNRILEYRDQGIPRPVAIILAYPALDFNFTSWMTPANLRVLRSEQSEVNIPGLLEGKDHLSHKSPLSVVDDTPRKKRRPGNKSRKTWADSITLKFGMTMSQIEPASPHHKSRTAPSSPVVASIPRPKSVSGWFALREGREGPQSTDGDHDEFVSEPEETDDDYEEDETPNGVFDHRSDAEKSLQERVKTPGILSEERFTDGILSLSPTTTEPDEISEPPATPPAKTRPQRAAFGTRLTMTSRVGYFQDRIISPSMMRAMAIMYVGQRACPDFSTDYYISPILTPAKNLAYFPPVYIICGERDPFVDDTVIFAGKLREAKRGRRTEAENATPGEQRHARFSDGTTNGSATDEDKSTIPDHILRETDDDWVQMRIIEGWGHGFMQMKAIMKEVDSVLTEMADWIDESFERAILLQKDQEEVAAAHAAAKAAFAPDTTIRLAAQDTLPSPLRSRHVKPVHAYTMTPANKQLGDADLGTGLGLTDADDGIVSFTPKNKRRTPPPSQFNVAARRASKESLIRSGSMLRFDEESNPFDDAAGDSAEESPAPVKLKGYAQDQPARGGGAFAFFGSGRSNNPKLITAGPKTAATSLYAGSQAAQRRGSGVVHPEPGKEGKLQNPLVAAAVKSAARAASPALAAAGLVPERVASVTQDELLRRRRAEAVYGISVTPQSKSDDDS